MNNLPLDVLGIGFGPANIALAIAAEELGSTLNMAFLEKNAAAGWQDDMLLPESDIQNHPLRDLVTPRNPRSRYTFVNFLFENHRLFEHLNLPLAHPLRLEYRQYVTWVAGHFERLVRYGCHAQAIAPIRSQGAISGYEVTFNHGQTVRARSLVLAPGRTPHLPAEFEGITDPRVIHFTRFLGAFNELKQRHARPRIAIVGGSQTAVELLLHVVGELPEAEVTGIHRNFGFRQKDTSPFSDEVYFPGFVDAYFHASTAHKQRLRSELLFTNYSASDRDVLDALYVHLYRNKIQNKAGLSIQHLTTVVQAKAEQDAIALTLHHTLSGVTETRPFDLVVLATGFKDLGAQAPAEPYPQLLAALADDLEMTEGALTVDLDYRVRFKNEHLAPHAPLFLNGLCESSHGMGDAGSFSLLSLRSAAIVQSLRRRLGESVAHQASRAGAVTGQASRPTHPTPMA